MDNQKPKNYPAQALQAFVWILLFRAFLQYRDYEEHFPGASIHLEVYLSVGAAGLSALLGWWATYQPLPPSATALVLLTGLGLYDLITDIEAGGNMFVWPVLRLVFIGWLVYIVYRAVKMTRKPPM